MAGTLAGVPHWATPLTASPTRGVRERGSAGPPPRSGPDGAELCPSPAVKAPRPDGGSGLTVLADRIHWAPPSTGLGVPGQQRSWRLPSGEEGACGTDASGWVAFQHRPEKGHSGKIPESSLHGSAAGVERPGTRGRSGRALADEEG